jgi:DNA relaxase NicK
MGTTCRAGIDWFSASYEEGDGAFEWAMKGMHALTTIAEEGYEVKQRNMMGYEGTSVANHFVGTRHDGYYIQITGHHANDYFSTLFDDNCTPTRIDIQVTVQFDEMPNELGKGVYDAVRTRIADLPGQRQFKAYEYSGTDGGYTVYIGAASSANRGLVYNKDREAGTEEYERCWRFEVRFRREYARKWAYLLRDSDRTRENAILAGTASWFDERGVNIYQYVGDTSVLLPKVASRHTDVDVKLKWLKSQVAPSIRWLKEHGYEEEALVALGLIV